MECNGVELDRPLLGAEPALPGFFTACSAVPGLCGKTHPDLTYRGGDWHGEQLSELSSTGMDFADKHLKLAWSLQEQLQHFSHLENKKKR